MAKVTLLNQVQKTATEAGVNGNGTFHLYTSPKQNTPASDNALEVIVKYENNSPNPDDFEPSSYNVSCVIETEDEAGNWHPIHYQFEPFNSVNAGNVHILKLDPTIFNLEEGQVFDMSNGLNIIARESRKQGTLPDDFRICILVNEYGHDENGATSRSFNHVTLTVSYSTTSV